jgi:3-keto-5-aminohexanoate cleavage enzyme
MILQITTEAVGRFQPQQQMQVVREVRPDCASVALRELITDPASEQAAADFFKWALTCGVGLQYIVYSAEDARRLVALQAKGVIPHRRPQTLFVLGRYTAGQRSQPSALLPFLQAWPADWPWSLCAFGSSEARCLAAGVALGGHPRVGFENNLSNPDGTRAASNAANVTTLCRLIELMGAIPATVRDARALYVGTQ